MCTTCAFTGVQGMAPAPTQASGAGQLRELSQYEKRVPVSPTVMRMSSMDSASTSENHTPLGRSYVRDRVSSHRNRFAVSAYVRSRFESKWEPEVGNIERINNIINRSLTAAKPRVLHLATGDSGSAEIATTGESTQPTSDSTVVPMRCRGRVVSPAACSRLSYTVLNS